MSTLLKKKRGKSILKYYNYFKNDRISITLLKFICKLPRGLETFGVHK